MTMTMKMKKLNQLIAYLKNNYLELFFYLFLPIIIIAYLISSNVIYCDGICPVHSKFLIKTYCSFKCEGRTCTAKFTGDLYREVIQTIHKHQFKV